MRWRLLGEVVLISFVIGVFGIMALSWTPDSRVGYGIIVVGLLVLTIGFAAARSDT
jgi:hypothetical protein